MIEDMSVFFVGMSKLHLPYKCMRIRIGNAFIAPLTNLIVI